MLPVQPLRHRCRSRSSEASGRRTLETTTRRLEGPAHASVGVYLHVPFCERVCPYCDFAVVAARPLQRELEGRYVRALERELEARAPTFAGRALASIYLGGGTPALLHPESVARLLAAVRAAFEGEPEEVTLEANPSSLERERLADFRAAGVDRLSLGVQSFDDELLKRLGRAHKGHACRESLDAARRAGFEELSLDLLVAGPGANPARLERDLAEVARFGPEHVSAYELTLEPGTPFHGAAERGRLSVPDEDEQLALLDQLERGLEAEGLERYEISSFARPGHEARHNQRYWQRRPVLGLGVGAWSLDPAGPDAPHGVRRGNPRRLDAWLEPTEAGREVAAGRDRLDPEAARHEALFLALRTRQGVSAADFAAEFGGPPRRWFAAEIEEFTQEGCLDEAPGGDLRLRARGRRLADTVFARLAAGPRGPSESGGR